MTVDIISTVGDRCSLINLFISNMHTNDLLIYITHTIHNMAQYS